MAESRPASLGAALTGALGAIAATKAGVKAAAAEAYSPPPLEDRTPSATGAPETAAKP